MDQLPQVKLRAIEPEDLEILYEIENNQDLWNVGVTNVPYSRYALHEYLANVSGDIYTDKQMRLIIESSLGELIGIVDLANFDPRHCRAEVGVVIQHRFRDQGYGRAAMLHLIRYAHEVIHLHQMYALIGKNNESCQKLFKEVGFQSVAELKEWLFDGEQYCDVVILQYFL
ncbi:MAG: GNAT family N-acetyltransferase [Prevotella sp.]|nr:GNAT family N-acetyltransferase [Prevotella sp.]